MPSARLGRFLGSVTTASIRPLGIKGKSTCCKSAQRLSGNVRTRNAKQRCYEKNTKSISKIGTVGFPEWSCSMGSLSRNRWRSRTSRRLSLKALRTQLSLDRTTRGELVYLEKRGTITAGESRSSYVGAVMGIVDQTMDVPVKAACESQWK